MKMIKRIGLAIAILAVTVLAFVTYLGGFQSVVVDEVDFPTTEIGIYLHKGSYKKIGDSWMKFDTSWKEISGEKCHGLALYFDPPGTPEDQLRSVLGCDLTKIPKEKQALVKEKFQSFVIPASKALHASFPFKNKLSFMLGPIKVYSAMNKTLSGTNITPALAIESYGVYEKMKQIEFYMPKDLKRESFDSLLKLFD
jgi:hypothetical protein